MESKNLKRSILAIACIAFTTFFNLQTVKASGVPTGNLLVLQKGVNLDGWFSNSSTLTPQHFGTFITVTDIKLIKQLGFTHVRLPVEPKLLFNPKNPATLNQANLAYLDKAVNQLLSHNIAVIIDMHPYDPAVKSMLETNDQYVESFSYFWGALAKHYSKLPKNKIFFEVLNEPHFSSVNRWKKVQNLLVNSIRVNAPWHTLIVAGASFSNLEDMLKDKTNIIPNALYSFHFYDQAAFTFQGASWMPYFTTIHDLPYPVVNIDACNQAVANISGLGVSVAKAYCVSGFNSVSMDKTIGHVARLAAASNTPLYMGEFGVIRGKVNDADRNRWYTDVVSLATRYHISWAVWEYKQLFGLLTRQSNGTYRLDKSNAKAMGLNVY